MSFVLFTGIIYIFVILLSIAIFHFFVIGGIKNLAIIYLFFGGSMVAFWLSNAMVLSDSITHKYDLNNYLLITEVRNSNKEYYYQLTFDSNNKTEKIEAEKITWIFTEYNEDFNVIEYQETIHRIIGTKIYLTQNEKKYEKLRLFIKRGG
ncbi:MAG: hypothetical protein WDK95_10465 [Syntrophorhabdaceae bacterium]